MADIGPGGRAVDDRAKQIKMRRVKHEIHQMEMTVEKYEIDVLEAEQNIERMHEVIEATRERADEKQLEYAALEGREDPKDSDD